MKDMLAADDTFLLLDKRRRIKAAYDSRMADDAYGLHWIQEMASQDKVLVIETTNINKGIKTKLGEAHFDWSDRIYVETASSGECKVLVTHDGRTFKAKIKSILKNRLQVTVCGAADACKMV